MMRKIFPRLNKERAPEISIIITQIKENKSRLVKSFVTGYYGWFMVLLLAKKGDLLWNESY